jgi:type I restriction enzyme S subunit
MNNYLRVDEVVASISKTHSFNKGKLKFLNTSDVYAGKIVSINELPVSELKGQAKKTIKQHDILLSEIRPKNRRYAYVGFEDTEDFVVSTKLMVLRKFNCDVDNRYLYYFLTNDQMLSALQARAENRICSFPQITFDLLSDYKIRVPELSEQEKIATILSSLDAKIDCNNRINAELEAMAKTLYDYWFVQFDFPDANGKPYKSSGGKMVYNAALKREIPAGWKDSNILSVADLLGGGTPTKKKPEYWSGDIPFFTPTDADGSIFKFSTADYITDDGLKGSSTKLFGAHTVFITARGSVGRLVLAGVGMAMNQSCYALRAKPGISHTYLFFLAKELIHHLQVKSSGSVFDSIVSSDIEFTYLAIPESTIIEKFAAVVEPAFEKIANNTKENQYLTQLRDWLLPMLMNGQVTVA